MDVQHILLGSNTIKKSFNIILLIILLIGTVIFFSYQVETFFTFNNLITIMLALAPIGIVCVGQTLLLLAGFFDISVGSTAGFAGVILVYLMNIFGVTSLSGDLLVFALALTASGILGYINGLLVTKVKINALITTLGTMNVYFGLSMIITKGKVFEMKDEFFIAFGTHKAGGLIPIPIIIFLSMIILFYTILRYTLFGRNIYAIGNNKNAARYSGINVDRVVILIFTIAGLLAGVAGILLVGKLTSAQAILGRAWPLNTIAACVLGGTLITGGKGGLIGSFLGITYLMILMNGLILMMAPTHLQNVITGILLLFALYSSGVFSGK